MTNLFLKTAWIHSVLLLAGLTIASSASASDLKEIAAPRSTLQSHQPLSGVAANQDDPEMAQVTSVSQLSDVRPTDWAFR